LVLAYCVSIGLFAGFHGVAKSFLLAANSLLTLIDPTGCGVLKFGTPLLNEIRAFTGLALDDLARFLTRLRREQHSDSDSDAQPQQKAGKSVLVHVFSFGSKPISSILRHRK